MDRIDPHAAHKANIFFLNANEMDDAYAHLGPQFFAGRYNIGYFAWELSQFPEAWVNEFRYFDEIWAPSRFIQQAVADKASCPVVWMPLAVGTNLFDSIVSRILRLTGGSVPGPVLLRFPFLYPAQNPGPPCAPSPPRSGKTIQRQSTSSSSSSAPTPALTIIGISSHRKPCATLGHPHQSGQRPIGRSRSWYGCAIVFCRYTARRDSARSGGSDVLRQTRGRHRLLRQPRFHERGQFLFGGLYFDTGRRGRVSLWRGPTLGRTDAEQAAWYLRRLVTDSVYATGIGQQARITSRLITVSLPSAPPSAATGTA